MSPLPQSTMNQPSPSISNQAVHFSSHHHHDDSLLSDQTEWKKKQRHRQLLSHSEKSHSCSHLSDSYFKTLSCSLLQDSGEIDKSEIRKVIVRTLPPLSNKSQIHSYPSVSVSDHAFSTPSYQRQERILIPLIYSVLEKQGISRNDKHMTGLRKEYYHAGQEIPKALLEFIHGFEWNTCSLFENASRNIQAGPFRFEKLSVLQDISEYLTALQRIDMKTHIFLSVTGRDLIGVDPTLISPDHESNFKVFVFRKNASHPEQLFLSELIEHCRVIH
ncbi:hypothetical protein FDP41_008227 [Naegleria fowleri]|uniref:Uncharacterized protein n=1 Tax=Naegleria fowleri TaxID=5763 RepID=A0A6A5B3F7_NAEFO|nr:uncharacterized protein FDP41_008227 [Naegleria fowleri]KAF0973523.1 hypothetical protein FDP41_008227 [Naegleria fowleri]